MWDECADPRPDIEKDSEMWAHLFRLVQIMAPLAMGDLKGFRCCGGALRAKNGKVALSRHRDLWDADGESYESLRDRLLGKWAENGVLTDLLRELPKVFPEVADRVGV